MDRLIYIGYCVCVCMTEMKDCIIQAMACFMCYPLSLRALENIDTDRYSQHKPPSLLGFAYRTIPVLSIVLALYPAERLPEIRNYSLLPLPARVFVQ